MIKEIFRTKYKKEKMCFGGFVKIAVLLFVVTCSGLFAACSEKNSSGKKLQEQEDGTWLYYLNDQRSRVMKEPLEPVQGSAEEQVVWMLSCLEARLWSREEVARLEENKPIVNFGIQEDNILTLQFADDYTMIHTTTSVLRRAAIVKTLCQIDGIDGVEIYIGTQPLLNTAGKPVGVMRAEDFVDNTGENTDYYQELEVVLYFSNATGDRLLETDVTVLYDGILPTEQLVLEQLTNASEFGARATLPAGTVVNEVVVKDGTCYVDFNDKFLEKRDGISAEVTVYSVVNTLAELNGIYEVKFSVNGKEKKNYHNMDFSSSFERNLDIVEGEQ